MSAQTANYPPVYKTGQFAFLAKPPPPPQKKRPSANQPLPATPGSPPPPPQQLQRRRSNTFSSIAAWAAHVQPGSPAPRSPQRRPSITSTTSSRRPSLSRRPSISHGRAPSGSFVHIIDTPTRTQSTPSHANFDLTALGYTSVFVHFPKTPTTPSPLLRHHQTNRTGAPAHPKPASPAPVPLSASFAFAHIPIPPVPQENGRPTKKTGMKRFRSLSILRSRGPKAKGTQPPASPTKTSVSTKSSKPMNASTAKGSARASPTTQSHTSKESKAEICAATIAKRKRAKYAYVRPPPPLANELAMMQFADGGSLESHAKRVMDAQAKAAAGSGASVGVADVYRDGKGGMWWDADEEMEYAHLLGGAGAVVDADAMDVDAAPDADMDWEEFDADAAEPLAPFFSETQQNPTHDKENLPEAGSRRSSLSSVDSDLDPKYLVPLPENEDPRLAPVDDRVLASRRIGGTGMSVLSLPARPRRRAMHLCKPGFLVDVKAFQAPRSPVRSTSGASGSGSTSSTQQGAKPRGKARRRPAPLKLANSSSASVVVVVRRPSVPAPVVASPGGVARLRREFIEDSFAPSVPAPSSVEAAPRPSLAGTAIFEDAASRAATPSAYATSRPTKSKLATGVRGFFTIRRGD